MDVKEERRVEYSAHTLPEREVQPSETAIATTLQHSLAGSFQPSTSLRTQALMLFTDVKPGRESDENSIIVWARVSRAPASEKLGDRERIEDFNFSKCWSQRPRMWEAAEGLEEIAVEGARLVRDDTRSCEKIFVNWTSILC